MVLTRLKLRALNSKEFSFENPTNISIGISNRVNFPVYEQDILPVRHYTRYGNAMQSETAYFHEEFSHFSRVKYAKIAHVR